MCCLNHEFLPQSSQSALAVTLMPTASAAPWNVPPSPSHRFAAGPSLSRKAGEGQVDGVWLQIDVLFRQFSVFRTKIDVSREKLYAIFGRIVTSAIQLIYFPSKVLADRIYLNSTTDCEIRRITGHANLPLARLQERGGPAAKQWEGEGARSLADTLHEALQRAVATPASEDCKCSPTS